MVKGGVPVFCSRENESFDPAVTDRKDPRTKEFWLPKQWQRTIADCAPIDRWSASGADDGALCMVCGVVLDVVDVDTKNGADVEVERRALIDFGVAILGESRTPSRGRHFLVVSTGIGSSGKKVNGVDYKGGRSDGTGRGFAYLPGTGRPR